MTHRRRFARASAVAVLLLLAACDGILDVDTSGILTPDDLDEAGPAAVLPIVNGVIYNYQEAVDDLVRYAALLTDEMISASTVFERAQVDERRILPSNLRIGVELYTPLHQARHLADTTVLVLQTRLGDPEFGSVTGTIRRGIALSRLYGGYSRVWLAELYCWSILTGVTPETAPLLPDARMRQALQFLREAEASAAAVGYTRVGLAAIVGQARVHLWLREYDQATAAASRVPREFRYEAEYSQNAANQFNEVYAYTWGEAFPLAWTVGSGGVATRGNELFEHFLEFVGLNLIFPSPQGFLAQSRTVPVLLQLLYQEEDSGILIASGVEALLIRAETAVRAGQTETAEQMLNDLRSDFSLRMLLHSEVPMPAVENQLAPLTLSGDMATDLKTVADERARELWLTGDRLSTSRRLRLDGFGIDLFPPVKTAIGGGDDIAFPIPDLELDANPNLTSTMACPAGQTVGSWR